MSEHPSSELLAQYNLRTLPSDTFLKVHQHVLSCPECEEKCNRPEKLEEDYAGLRSALLSAEPDETPFHLSTAEARAYIKNELGEIDLEIAEGHLELCNECRESVEKLRDASVSSARPKALPPRSVPAWIAHLRPRHVVTAAAGLLILLVTLAIIRTRIYDRAVTVSNPGQANANANQPAVPQERPSSVNGPVVAENRNSDDVKDSSEPPDTGQPSSSEARDVVVINDNGRRIILDSSGNLSGLENLPEDLRQEIRKMLVTGRVRISSESEGLNDERATLLSESSGDGLPFRLLSPVSKVIPDNRPTFRWQPLEGAESYVVTVTDAQFNQVSISEPMTSTAWKIPNPLKYGGTYSWQVTAIKNGQKITSPVLPAPQAKFKVIAYDKLRELRQAQKAYAGSHLSLAAYYIRLGLLDKAEEELKTLVSSNPQSSVAKSLLRSLRR